MTAPLVFITGASSGIGQALAARYAQAGWRLALVARRGAEVRAVDAAGSPLVMRGEFLHAFLLTERVKSHLPVTVEQVGANVHASGLDYDNAIRRLELKGPLRVVLSPRGPAVKAATLLVKP